MRLVFMLPTFIMVIISSCKTYIYAIRLLVPSRLVLPVDYVVARLKSVLIALEVNSSEHWTFLVLAVGRNGKRLRPIYQNLTAIPLACILVTCIWCSRDVRDQSSLTSTGGRCVEQSRSICRSSKLSTLLTPHHWWLVIPYSYIPHTMPLQRIFLMRMRRTLQVSLCMTGYYGLPPIWLTGQSMVQQPR